MADLSRGSAAAEGALPPARSSNPKPSLKPWRVLLRWSWRQCFASKLVWPLIAAAAITFLAFGVIIYLRYNLAALGALHINLDRLVPINAEYFRAVLVALGGIAGVLTLVIAPGLITSDLANNGLPLYFSRPLGRGDYLAGKLLAPAALLSLITWVPALLLFALQAYLGGGDWLSANRGIAAAIFIGAWAWIALLLALATALAAGLRRRLAAGIVLVCAMIVPGVPAGILNQFLTRPWADLFTPLAIIGTIWDGLFGLAIVRPRVLVRNGRAALIRQFPLPAWSAWVALGVLVAVCGWVLARRLRAYQETRG